MSERINLQELSQSSTAKSTARREVSDKLQIIIFGPG